MLILRTRPRSIVECIAMRRVSHELTMPHKQRDASAFGEGTINHAKLIPAYSLTARVLHWITAFLILTMIPLGLVIANEWGGFAQDALYNLHRSIGTSAYRAPVIVFGLFELPPIWRESRAFSEQLFFVHALIGISIACLAAAHVGAALYHHFVRRDRVLLR